MIAFRQVEVEPRLTDLWGSRPLTSAPRLLPVVRLDPGPHCEADVLFGSIPGRTTCRRLDHKRPLPPALLSQLSDSIGRFPSVTVDWITEPKQMAAMARLVGAGNRIRFEHEPFHAEFYHNLRLTPEEARSSCDGLDLDTLQLPPSARVMLRLMRSWSRIRIANSLGFSRAIERQARCETLASAAIGVLTVDAPSALNFLDGGRALERIWLTASAAGVGLHPAASPAVFLAHVDRTDGSKMLPAHLRTARDMKRQFNLCLPASQGRSLQMIFRLGYPSWPARPSLRRPLRDSIESEPTQIDPEV